ncbi:MAG: calcium-binding protein [Pseudomonadota bacterium]
MENDDTVHFNIDLDPALTLDLGVGDDVVGIDAEPATSQVRVTFTSAEVGNGRAVDAGTMTNQDGGLAVRVQAEGASDVLVGAISRFDDEGIRLDSAGGFTFDVRDLVSGVARGNQFDVVQLGTGGADTYDESGEVRAYYVNAGMGNDTVSGGQANDFLVGGAGNDQLRGRAGNDSFIGGGGDDLIYGGRGNDTAIFNTGTDGTDRVDLGEGLDTVNVAVGANTTQVRLTFTSAEIGNGSATDAGSLTNQDGGLAVRLQSEITGDVKVGLVSRFDDEGTRFVSTGAFTFDVRDLVSGAARGDQFAVVQLGTAGNDTIDESASVRATYVNAGMGNDTISGGSANDFLVGGAGDDMLVGLAGNDSFIGGGGMDRITGNGGDDTAILNVSTDGPDRVNLGSGMDSVNVAAAAGVTQVRLTFTSAEVGNGALRDAGTLANQDGAFAVRVQAEGAADALAGDISRFDDEGIRFVSTGAFTFDVRDLVSGTARGDQFAVVDLGTSANNRFDESDEARSYYVNAGMGDDTITGSQVNDFLVGGAGNDVIDGGAGDDSFIGGIGSDTFVFAGNAGADSVLDFVSGTDKLDLSDYGVGFGDITTTAIGSNTLVSVDTDGDAIGDVQFTLINAAAPVAGDYIFA